MFVTTTGIVFLVVGGMSLFLPSFAPFFLAVFFMPFSATAVFDNPIVTPYVVFGLLFLVAEMIRRLAKKNPPQLGSHHKKCIFTVLFFIASVVMSMSMPLAINGQLWVDAAGTFDVPSGPLFFTKRSVMVPVYIFFGLALAYFISTKLARDGSLAAILRIFCLSGFFMAVWGLFHFLCELMDIPYPNEVFNNSIEGAAQGYKQPFNFFGSSYTRICSAALEPAIFSQYMITVIAILSYQLMAGGAIFSRLIDGVILSTSLAAIALSMSTGGIVGALLLGALILPALWIGRSLNKVNVSLVLIPALLLGAGMLYIGDLEEVIDLVIERKGLTGSGDERLATVFRAWVFFIDYPFLGIGWGSATTHDLIVNILASGGIIGFITFVTMAIFPLFGPMIFIRKVTLNREFTLNRSVHDFISVALAYVVLFLLMVPSGFTYYLGTFWLLFGMVVAGGAIIEREAARGLLAKSRTVIR